MISYQGRAAPLWKCLVTTSAGHSSSAIGADLVQIQTQVVGRVVVRATVLTLTCSFEVTAQKTISVKP